VHCGTGEKERAGVSVRGRGRGRRFSALFWTAGLAAALVVAWWAGAAATRSTANGSIEICKSGANGAAGQTFSFTLTKGTTSLPPVTVTAPGCSRAVTVAAGSWTVQEDLSSGSWMVAGISVLGGTVVTETDSAGKIKVTVPAGANETQVSFTNAPVSGTIKVCKWSSTPSFQGKQYSFTAAGQTLTAVAGSSAASAGCSGAVSLAPGSRINVTENVPANQQVAGVTKSSNLTIRSQGPGTTPGTYLVRVTLGNGANVLTFDNEPLAPPQRGTLEICKDAGDQFVAKDTAAVVFSVVDSAGVTHTVPVNVGQCSGGVDVAAGNVTVTETIPDNEYVSKISLDPLSSGALGPTNPTNGTAVVVVPINSAGDAMVHFQNSARTAQVKICKFLTASSAGLSGTSFHFTVNDAVGTQTLDIIATSSSSGSCKLLPVVVPVGSQVTATESGTPYVSTDGQAPGTGDTVTQTVVSGITEVDFLNQALGQIEICKTVNQPAVDGNGYDDGNAAPQPFGGIFSFSVDGSKTLVAVASGHCTQPMLVAPGTHTVQEVNLPYGFQFSSSKATGPTTDNRCLPAVANCGNPATITVPFFNDPSNGGETRVDFTNDVQLVQLKVCKQIEPGSTTPLGKLPFTFDVFVNGGVGGPPVATTTVSPPYPGPASCSGLLLGVPVINPDGTPVYLTVIEHPGGTYGVSAVSVDNIKPGTTPTPMLGEPGGIRFTPGVGIDVVTVTNRFFGANIQLSPLTASDQVGDTHTVTITVNALGGTLDPGPHQMSASTDFGSFVGPNTCTYTGGGVSASCTVAITSAATGTSTVSAAGTIPVSGAAFTRTTGTALNTAAGGSGNATKNWVNANIRIGQGTDTNAVGTTHTLTIAVAASGQIIDPGTHTITASIVSGPGGFVGNANTCTYTGGVASSKGCLVVITSTTAGDTVVQATADVPINGAPITVTTGTAANTAAGGSGNVTKHWVDASISLDPLTDADEVGDLHTLTVKIAAVNGTLDAGPHTATLTKLSGPGDIKPLNPCTYPGGGTSATCIFVTQGNDAGTDTYSASSDIPVSGQTITRTTGDPANTAAGGSGVATKNWVDARITMTPFSATNPTGTTHTLTISVDAFGGTIDAGTHTATAKIVAGPGGFVGSVNTCTYSGGSATASCNVVITSTTPGTTTVQATGDIPVSGVTLSRSSQQVDKTWVDANISIAPSPGAEAITNDHTLTITVNALGGDNIDPGTHTATAAIVSGPGNFEPSGSTATCTYSGGNPTAFCTVLITANSTKNPTVVSATSDIPVGGYTITRATNTAANTASGGSGNATTTWVNAFITLSPLSATNPLGVNHTITVTVTPINGTIDPGTHTVTASMVPPNTTGGFFNSVKTCTYTDTTPTCNIVITSSQTGTAEVKVTADIPVSGSVVNNRNTGQTANTNAGGTGNAMKTWAQGANISISGGGTNVAGDTRTLTITVASVGGFLDTGTYTATAKMVNGNTTGNFAAQPDGNTNMCVYIVPASASSASCNVLIRSNSSASSTGAGTTEVQANANILVGGVSIPRTTNTTTNTNAGGSLNTFNQWVNANIQLTGPTAAVPHASGATITVTVNALNGNIDLPGPYTATATIVGGGPGSLVGGGTCSYTAGAATATCTIQLTSTGAGSTTVRVNATPIVSGQSIARQTGLASNTNAGGTGNFTITWT
jgi:hypothetical protein